MERAHSAASMGATRATLARTRDWKSAFLADYRQHGCVSFAAKAAKVHRKTVYRALEQDADFRAAVAGADATDVRDVLVHEAYRRGVLGYDKPVFQGGEKVGVVREYSDTLLTKLLEARVPEFGRKMALTGEGGGPIATATTVTVVTSVPRPASDAGTVPTVPTGVAGA